MTDCIIVGGGVIGMLTARELHLAGVDVLLIEKSSLGGESSWAGGGIISPLYPWRYQPCVNILAERSKLIYPQLAKKLTEESGINCELIQSGLLIIDEDEIQQGLNWSAEWSVTMEHVSGKKLIQEIEPAISTSVERGLWMPQIMQIRNPKLLQALQGSFKKLSIPYMENTEVLELAIHSGRVSGVRIADKTIAAEKVIVAGGAWTAGLTGQTKKINVEPVKGQMIMIKAEPDMVKRIILSNGHYVIPRSDGRVLAGSTLEKTGFDKSISENALEELRANAIALVPQLKNYSVERQWAGLRPGTVHGIPYICAHDEVAGLFIHAGHYRNGIVLGAASVQLMADLILDRSPWCDTSPYTMSAVH